MSDSILKLIPSSPTYVPKEDSKQRAMDSVGMLFPLARRVTFKQSDNPQFIDQGGNLERIICPNCSAVIDKLWWNKAMDKAYESKFIDLSVVVPCCNSNTTLSELKYEWPAGFSQFSIEIINPNRGISDEELQGIESILDTKLRIIWAHY